MTSLTSIPYKLIENQEMTIWGTLLREETDNIERKQQSILTAARHWPMSIIKVLDNRSLLTETLQRSVGRQGQVKGFL
jgi:hypothetical protein